MTEGGPFTQTVFVHVKNEEEMLMAKHTSKKKEKDTSRPKPSKVQSLRSSAASFQRPCPFQTANMVIAVS